MKLFSVKIVKWWNAIALHRKPISELWSVTHHMGSHGVTCHLTQGNVPRLNPIQTELYSICLPWSDGRLSWPGYIPRWFTHPQTVTHPSTNRAWCRGTWLIGRNVLPLHHATNSCKNIWCRWQCTSALGRHTSAPHATMTSSEWLRCPAPIYLVVRLDPGQRSSPGTSARSTCSIRTLARSSRWAAESAVMPTRSEPTQSPSWLGVSAVGDLLLSKTWKWKHCRIWWPSGKIWETIGEN